MNNKIKSSALLIAIIVGIVLMTSSVGVAVLISQNVKLSGQARDGKIAYRAALSGIDDGLLRYKYARASSNPSDMTNFWKINPDNPERVIISDGAARPPEASYELSFSASSLSVGSAGKLNQKVNMDDTADIDLTPYLQSPAGLSEVEIYFSKPFLGANQQNDKFTALNVRLVNILKQSESQLIEEQTNVNSSNKSVAITKIDQCVIDSSQCHIKIRPQLALKNGISEEAKRIKGEGAPNPGGTPIPGGKYMKYAVVASDKDSITIDPIEGGTDKPGTIIITSVGIAGQARHKIEAKIDASSGTYLGLFDYGVYCGDQCNWGSSELQGQD